MNIIRVVTKEIVKVPVNVVKGAYDAIEEIVNGEPKKQPKK